MYGSFARRWVGDGGFVILMKNRGRCLTLFEMMVIITLLILINFLIALARIQRKKWLRILLIGFAAFLLLPAFMFGLRMFLKG